MPISAHAISDASWISVVNQEFHAHNMVFDGDGRRETQALHQMQHRRVLGQHLADETLDAALAGDIDESLHQMASQPLPLIGVAHHQGELRRLPVSG